MSTDNGYRPIEINAERCDGCGECKMIAPAVFRQKEKEVATIIDPKGNPFKALVRSAERCVARAIYPGAPWDYSAKGVERLIRRADRFNP